jgi:uncharacterized protein (TIGR00730 family)
MRTFQSIGVFCGSAVGARSEYAQKAASLGTLLGEQGITLIYGAGNVGLMGVMADACIGAGGKVIGVITEKLVKVELAHKDIQETIIVETMAERKTVIAEMSDAFVAMPGGYGTFDELFEVLTLMQLNIMNKPIGLLNVSNYFDPFVALVRKGIDERFIRREHEAIFAVGDEPEVLLALMRQSKPVETRKWLDDFKHNKF